jgi:hypothetical protein
LQQNNMGAPKGNRNGAHDKPWTRALERHAAQNPDKLEKLAAQAFDAALNGDVQTLKEIGDRLDGKPRQSVDNTHTGDVTISVNTGVKRAGD